MTGKVGKFSNYTNGFSGGLTLRGVPVSMNHPGKVIWVGTSAAQNTLGPRKSPSDGNKGTFMDPYATLDAAMAATKADRGDVIMVLAGHAETLAAAVTCDIAGVSIIGLGNQANRPQFTGAVAADLVSVTADDVTIQGLYFNEKTTASATTATIDIAAAGCSVKDCHFDCGANEVLVITVTAAGETPIFDGNVFNVTANGIDNAIQLEGVVDRALFTGNTFIASVTNGPDDGYWVSFEATACTNPIFSGGNLVVQSGDALYGNEGSVVALVDADAAQLGDIRVLLAPSTPDDEEVTIADITGTVNIWGILGFTETALTAAVNMGVTASGNGATLIATTVEGGDENGVAGDLFYATTGGGAVVEVETGTAVAQIDPIWPAPIKASGTLTGENTGTPSTGVIDYVIYWSPVSGDGLIADE